MRSEDGYGAPEQCYGAEGQYVELRVDGVPRSSQSLGLLHISVLLTRILLLDV